MKNLLNSAELHLPLNCIQAFPQGFSSFSRSYWIYPVLQHTHNYRQHMADFRGFERSISFFSAISTSNLLEGGGVNSQIVKFYGCKKDKGLLQLLFPEGFALAQAVRILLISF